MTTLEERMQQMVQERFNEVLDRLLCRRGHHDWRVSTASGELSDGRAFRRLGETVPCRRGCGAVLIATRLEWQELQDFKPSDTPETDPTTSPDTPPRGTRPNNKEIA